MKQSAFIKITGMSFLGYFLRTILLLFSIAPLGYVISILGFYFHAQNVLGWYPTYGNPDPKELNFYYDYSPCVDTCFTIWGYSLVGWIVALILCSGLPTKIQKRYIAFSALGHVMAFVITLSPVFAWYVD